MKWSVLHLFIFWTLTYVAAYGQGQTAGDGQASTGETASTENFIANILDSLSHLSFNQRFPNIRELTRGKKEELKGREQWLSDYLESNQELPNCFLIDVEFVQLDIQGHLGQVPKEKVIRAWNNLSQKANRSKCKQMAYWSQFQRANIMWGKGDRNQAMLVFDSLYNLVQHISDSVYYLKKEIIGKYGECYFSLGDYDNAKYYLSKASEYMSLDDSLYRYDITLFNNLGLVHLATGSHKKALTYFEKALQVARDKNSEIWQGILSGNIGHVYGIQKKPEEAEKWLSRDVELSLKRGARGSAASALLNLAGIKMRQGEIRTGQVLMDSAIQLKSDQSLGRKSQIYPLMSKIKGYEGDWESAARYLDSSLMIKDSLFKRQNELKTVRQKQRTELENSKAAIVLAKQKEAQQRQRLWYIGVGLFIMSVLAILIFIQQRRTQKARKLSDRLLLNILPENVAKELKSTGSTTAHRFDVVTVLFSDFVGFTKVSENLSAVELVKILDYYFEGFDLIMEEHGIEKIKTVGDAYLSCAGLPVPIDDHAQRIAKAALEMRAFVKQSPYDWGIRIGIHSGPVVAGVVGIKKFAYDVWGDTVNTAARMEQSSEGGKINISAASYQLLKNQFRCTYRGKVRAKNKGEMDMYFLEGEIEG